MADSEVDAILAAASAALNPSPDISGCPDTAAMLAAAAVLRAAAVWVEDIQTYRDLRRWADDIDDRATGSAPGSHWSARLIREAKAKADPSGTLSPYGPIVDPCAGCGCAKAWHRQNGCTGDFLCCPCETWMPLDDRASEVTT